MVMASTAFAIVMGATTMAVFAVLRQLAPVLVVAPSGYTIRHVLNLTDDRALARTAQARARVRSQVWRQIEAAGAFSWLKIAGRTLSGWLFLDVNGTLIIPGFAPSPASDSAAGQNRHRATGRF